MTIVRNSINISSDDAFVKGRWAGACYDSELERHRDKESSHVYLQMCGLAICPRCGRLVTSFNGWVTREARDCPIYSNELTYVYLKARRVRCECGFSGIEQISWLEPHAKITNSLRALIQGEFRYGNSIKGVCLKYDLTWNTVAAIERDLLEYVVGDVSLKGVEHLAIDEISFQKGHKYVSVIMDVEHKKILFMCRGKSQEDIQPFFDRLKREGRLDQIKSVSCDMNAAYPGIFEKNIPNAKINYDLFHVMAMLRIVLKEAKAHSLKDLRHRKQVLEEQAARRGEKAPDWGFSFAEVAKADWLLVRRREDLSDNSLRALENYLKENALMEHLQVVPDLLRKIWATKNERTAMWLLKDTIELLMRIAAKFAFRKARSFAKTLNQRALGIVTAGRLGFGTGRLEGVNNALKVIKRDGYGYRDLDHFRLKAMARFSGSLTDRWKDIKRGTAVIKGRLWSIFDFQKNILLSLVLQGIAGS